MDEFKERQKLIKSTENQIDHVLRNMEGHELYGKENLKKYPDISRLKGIEEYEAIFRLLNSARGSDFSYMPNHSLRALNNLLFNINDVYGNSLSIGSQFKGDIGVFREDVQFQIDELALSISEYHRGLYRVLAPILSFQKTSKDQLMEMKTILSECKALKKEMEDMA